MRATGDCDGAMIETRPVEPATCTSPDGSAATDCATVSLGNRAAEDREEPVGLRATTKSPPCDHPCVLGKSWEAVVPATQTLPEESSVTELTTSASLPPMYVPQTTPVPPGLSLTTKASVGGSG